MNGPAPRSAASPRTFSQETANTSPWSVGLRVRMVLWEFCWAAFCLWTPKPFNPWRLIWLRLFGATILGRPFVHQRARIQLPWNLILHDRSCLGDRANVYTLAEIEIGARAVIAQESYLCTGTHDLSSRTLALQVARITIGEDVFIGARAFVMPGISIGRGAVVGACAVVTKSVAKNDIVAGNPAKKIGVREWQPETAADRPESA